MVKLLIVFLVGIVVVLSAPSYYYTQKFRVGIEYDKSIPMNGGSDRYRHRNNYEPFFVAVTTEAKKNFVITFLDVTATVDDGGEVDFRVIKGQTGARSMTFQLVSNHSDFLSFSYLAYGIREEEYRKIANIIVLPMPSDGWKILTNPFCILFVILYCFIVNLF